MHSISRTPPTQLSCLPNEVVLIIWTYLSNVEAIKSFGEIGCQRYTRLLESYCYQSIDFYASTLSTFERCCTDLLDQFRKSVQTLKLGHRHCYSQLRIFSHHRLTSSSLIDVFPQLEILVLSNVHEDDVTDLAPYLSIIPFIRSVTLNNCPLNQASTLICEHLLKTSIPSRLSSCTLHSTNRRDGIVISSPISSFYHAQHTLTYLRIDVRDLTSLKYLLMLCPGLFTLDVHLGTDVEQNNEELFPSSFDPCRHLTKLVLRLRNMIVQDISRIAQLILLFQRSLHTLHLALMHQDPNYGHSLTYIDGHWIFNSIVIYMRRMREFSFWIETTCLCNQQMEKIIRSFQTEYWLTMHIGCYYDSINCVYVIFTLPFLMKLRFIIMHDTIHTKFNQTRDDFNCLVPMLVEWTPGVILLVSENESLSCSLTDMLKRGSYQRKSIKIKPTGVYQLEHSDLRLTQFNQLELERCYANQPGDGFIPTTITWLNWMPNLRSLNIDMDIFLHLTIHNINIDRFSSLKKLVLCQINNPVVVEPLVLISHFGVSTSLCTIHVKQYSIDSHPITDGSLLLIYQICHKISQLKVMTIEFSSKNALLHNEVLRKLSGAEKKNCRFEHVHVSSGYLQLWIEQ